MIEADSVHSTPPTNTSANNQEKALARQEAKRQRALKRIAKLRRKASDEIDRLLAFLDASDPYAATELEAAVDDVPCDGDDDSEDSLGSVGGNQTRWSAGDAGDREGDGCADDREDVCEDEGAEHDGAEPDVDEPWLGWTEAYAQGEGHAGPPTEWEETPPVVTEAARSRYRKGKADRYAVNTDGKHVDSERGAGRDVRHLRNLSPKQKGLVQPKVRAACAVF